MPANNLVFTVLDSISRATTLALIVAAGYGAVLWARGIAPVLLRLGNGLSRRRVALFARGDMLTSLGSLLDDSKLFRRGKVVPISLPLDLGKAEGTSLFVMAWHDWKEELPQILARKRDGTALIVYAPQELGFIPPADLAKLNSHRNVVVCNFRGRLMNDIVVSMITTSYEE